ncbi:MAG: hypothetical protein ACTSUD_00270 [Alphaproteobacteria bacterium]
MTGSRRAFWHLVFVGATGVPTFMTTYYYYQLMTQLGLLLALPLVLFLVGQICLLIWLGKHPNLTVRTIGQAFGTVFMYLALFEGLLLIVLVFYVLGGGQSAGGPGAFAADFVIGATYLSMMVYGAMGLGPLLSAETIAGKLAAWGYLLVALVPPFWLVFFQEEAIRAFAATRPGTLLMSALAYYALMSVVGMGMMTGWAPAHPGRKARSKEAASDVE